MLGRVLRRGNRFRAGAPPERPFSGQQHHIVRAEQARILHEQFVYKIGSALIAQGQQLSPADQARFELSRKRMEILK